MNIVKTSVATAVATVLGATSYTAQAALTTGSVLEFGTGSYFAWDSNFDGTIQPAEKVPVSMYNGIIIGSTQLASGSHGGIPDNTESPDIDNPWVWGLNTGMHQSLSPITVVDNDVNNDGGLTKTLDFSGWGMTWNGILNIPLGGGAQDCGTSTDGICVTPGLEPVDISGTYDNGTGLATITCSTASCSTSSTFTLTYDATAPQADPSSFGGAYYVLNLEGHVGAVPVPAAAWLFGSGLAGLAGVARRKNRNRK